MLTLIHFYPRSPYGERRRAPSPPRQEFYFYPRSPYGERHWVDLRWFDCFGISIHALLTESDIAGRITSNGTKISIHALLTESDIGLVFLWWGVRISIHALLTESDLYDTYAKVLRVNISIHALLTESDYRAPPYNLMIQHISIHALLTESDPGKNLINGICLIFLSTLSLRRATWKMNLLLKRCRHFYPRSPYGERHPSVMQEIAQQRISIHALLTESDHRSNGNSSDT